MSIAELEQQILELQESQAQLALDLDTTWVLIAATLVFFMQAGFALLEAGSIQQKNVTNILLKNLMDVCVGSLFWYLIGFGFAFGDKEDNPFIGDRYFALSKINDSDSSQTYALFFFQLTFAATAATIVSGCVAERCRMTAYLIYTSIISAWIYPVVVHWGWSTTGWLSAFRDDEDGIKRVSNTGYIDFAGSGIVHMVGGGAGLMGAIFIGPRLGRFVKGKSFTGKIHGHNITLSALGTFILWTGWYGFNPGSTLLVSGGVSNIAARAAVTTTLAAAMAGLTVLVLGLIYSRFVEKALVLDLALALNGVLAGLVSITAGCAVVQPWAAVIIGFLGAFVYFGASKGLELLRIDDPVDAAPIHFFCGAWGVIAAGLFAWEDNIKDTYGLDDPDDYGLFVGGHGRLFAAQLIGVIVITVWTLSQSALVFFLLRITGLLRVSKQTEIEGLDLDHHGGTGYDLKGRSGTLIIRQSALSSNNPFEDKILKKITAPWKKSDDKDIEIEMGDAKKLSDKHKKKRAKGKGSEDGDKSGDDEQPSSSSSEDDDDDDEIGEDEASKVRAYVEERAKGGSMIRRGAL